MLSLATSAATAQGRKSDTLKEQSPAPLELPNFIIEGTENLNVRSGIKQMPAGTQALTRAELDSLNSLEKQMSVALPISELPDRIYEYRQSRGFLQGSFGNFITPSLEAGWGLNYEGYELFTNGGFEMSNGHVDNAGYQDFFFRATSDFISPEKFFIFGGSKTRTELNFNHRGYKLYAADDPDERGLTNFALDLKSDGKSGQVQFSTGAGFSTMQLSSGDNDAFDNSLHGFLNIHSLWRSYFVSANADIDFRSVRGDANNFAELSAAASYFSDEFTIQGGTGFQYAAATNDNNRSGVIINGKMEYRMSKLFTIKSAVESGLDKVTFDEMLKMNPFLHHSSVVDYPYKIFMIHGALLYHPTPKFAVSPGIHFGVTDRYPVFTSIGDTAIAEIGLSYEKVNIFELFAESYWLISDNDKFGVYAKVNFSETDNGKNELAYVPNYEMELDYRRKWGESFVTSFGIEIVGDRQSDLVDGENLDAFFDLNFSAEYFFSRNLKIFFAANNLLNSDIYVWEGYKERDLFINFGVNWKFD